ncbi:MAG: hypothetical protein IJR52_06110 [Selenomonadaceae bacterium]|nr:hypothetical protein [Selenomonadaceae bacterium]
MFIVEVISLKIYDCFTFYNEFELLELRLKALWDVVDYFVIVEANRKHNGEPKDFTFPKRAEEFKEFWSKIRFVKADLSAVPFKGVGDWAIENAQRNMILHGIEDAAPDDLIMISDLDEIPAPNVVRAVRGGQLADILEKSPLVMAQAFHYYFFDLICPTAWHGTILTRRKNLTTPQELRNARGKLPRVSDGGHHFSYMGGVDRVIDKMTSIVDGNGMVFASGGKLIDREHVEKSLANGTDIYNRQGNVASQFYPYDAREIRLPHVDEFLKKYPHFLHEPEKYFTK